jgi:hypothetical protein
MLNFNPRKYNVMGLLRRGCSAISDLYTSNFGTSVYMSVVSI